MSNIKFPRNLAIKCNKQDAYKFIEWCKNNSLLDSNALNTLENPWMFD